MKVAYKVAGKTDVGLVREGNEDALKIDQDNNLFIVCDGMGGHQAGEVASREACDVVAYCFTDLASQIQSRDELKLIDIIPPRGDLLVKAIRIANRSVYIRSRSNSALTGMGTTIVAMALEEGLISIAHAGDSRAYRLYGNKLSRLTNDHSWVSELQASGQMTEAEANKIAGKNVITRALGVNERVDIDYRANLVTEGEIYILCSDGLCGFAEDDEIEKAANDCNGNVEKITDTLVRLANEHGGQDNVTVLALRIEKAEIPENTETYGPVTVSKENEQAINVENEIVKSIIDLKSADEPEEEEDTLHQVQSKSAFGPFLLIALAFIIVAAAFIFFYSGD